MSTTVTSLKKMGDVSVEAWKTLSQQKIYFAHQSVGFNIMEGVEGLSASDKTIQLSVVETRDPNSFDHPVFAHSTIGENQNPKAKYEDFLAVMKSGVGEKVDMAFLKLCYVDVRKNTDVGELFRLHKETYRQLGELYPEVRFVHFTVPLTITQAGPKALVKKLIGRSVRGFDDNIKRSQFNELLRKEYQGKAPVFDVAKAESVASDGRQRIFTDGNRTYEAMHSDYTTDGGHLNPAGRAHVGEQLLVFLTDLL